MREPCFERWASWCKDERYLTWFERDAGRIRISTLRHSSCKAIVVAYTRKTMLHCQSPESYCFLLRYRVLLANDSWVSRSKLGALSWTYILRFCQHLRAGVHWSTERYLERISKDFFSLNRACFRVINVRQKFRLSVFRVFLVDCCIRRSPNFR